VLILPVARVGVEVEAADQLAPVVDAIGFRERRPLGRAPRPDVDPEQILRELEEAVADAAVVEILPRLLPVISVRLLLDEVGDIAAVSRL